MYTGGQCFFPIFLVLNIIGVEITMMLQYIFFTKVFPSKALPFAQ